MKKFLFLILSIAITVSLSAIQIIEESNLFTDTDDISDTNDLIYQRKCERICKNQTGSTNSEKKSTSSIKKPAFFVPKGRQKENKFLICTCPDKLNTRILAYEHKEAKTNRASVCGTFCGYENLGHVNESYYDQDAKQLFCPCERGNLLIKDHNTRANLDI